MVRPIRVSSLGFGKLVEDTLRRRHRHRQFVGIVALLVIVVLSQPWHAPGLFWPGAALAGVGIAIRLWASGHVKKDKELATGGPYALVRHPLYLGNHLLFIGFCLTSGLWWSPLVWLGVTLLYYPPAIRHEDAKLESLFGEAWRRWRAVTPAIVPRLRRPAASLGGRWSLAQSLKANGEPIIAAVLVALLWVVHQRIP